MAAYSRLFEALSLSINKEKKLFPCCNVEAVDIEKYQSILKGYSVSQNLQE